MAQVRYRANLSAKDFVFTAQDWGRSVIMKQYDQNFSRQIVSPTDPDKDIGIPQIFYGHNIMPSAQGFQSVGVPLQVAGPEIGIGSAFQMLDWATTNSVGETQGQLLVIDLGGGKYNFWSLSSISGGWTLAGLVTGIPASSEGIIPVTAAIIGGLTYIYVPYTGCFSWDGTTWSAVTLTGLTASAIVGICESFGYMIAWSTSAVAWSSTISPTDFTPSLITGAGGGSISSLKGSISWCQHHTFGFIAFSNKNCVAAVYSGNARYPFNFREIIGGGGLDSDGPGYFSTTLDSESGNLYGYTTSGMQIISVTQAQVVFPEMVNYIGGKTYEDFNDTTLLFTETQVNAFYRSINVVANRYLVVSYSNVSSQPQLYQYALVYDIAMKRWGKIKFTHRQAFTFGPEFYINAARNSLGFIDVNGSIYIVDFSQYATSGGTIILGKYQHARDRLITLLQVDLEYTNSGAAPTVYDMITLDGKTFQTPKQMNPIAQTTAPQYVGRQTGMNHSLIIQGVFQLDSLMLTYIANGRR